jgi:hypothetical protein
MSWFARFGCCCAHRVPAYWPAFVDTYFFPKVRRSDVQRDQDQELRAAAPRLPHSVAGSCCCFGADAWLTLLPLHCNVVAVSHVRRGSPWFIPWMVHRSRGPSRRLRCLPLRCCKASRPRSMVSRNCRKRESTLTESALRDVGVQPCVVHVCWRSKVFFRSSARKRRDPQPPH